MITSDGTATGGPVARASNGPAAPKVGPLRCSDAERDATGAILHDAVGDGRLTVDEAGERLAAVYSARYRDELAELTADLGVPGKSVGWAAVATLARRQFADDVAALLGSAPGRSADRARAVLSAMAALFLVVSMAVLLLHGIVGDGPEAGHGFH